MAGVHADSARGGGAAVRIKHGPMLGFAAHCRPVGIELESTMKQLSLALAVSLTLAACGSATEKVATPEAASDQPAVVVPPQAAAIVPVAQSSLVRVTPASIARCT